MGDMAGEVSERPEGCERPSRGMTRGDERGEMPGDVAARLMALNHSEGESGASTSGTKGELSSSSVLASPIAPETFCAVLSDLSRRPRGSAVLTAPVHVRDSPTLGARSALWKAYTATHDCSAACARRPRQRRGDTSLYGAGATLASRYVGQASRRGW